MIINCAFMDVEHKYYSNNGMILHDYQEVLRELKPCLSSEEAFQYAEYVSLRCYSQISTV